jgi:ubiquinone/menaquinone biosynthesis C-methylase UbiE
MLFRTMKRLIKSTPAVRRTVTRLSYEILSRGFDDPRLVVMNYGYAALTGDGHTMDLLERDEWSRFSLQLYHRVAGAVDLTGKEVLEVGGGRGGGAEFVARTMSPKQLVCTDVSAAAMDFATRTHAATPNVTFQQADAENLPFGDDSFDAVINVESSHCYGTMDSFLGEVARVLRPGGHLLFADVRDTPDAPALETALRENRAGLKLLELEDITAHARAALDFTGKQKEELLMSIAAPLRRMFRDQSGIPGGAVYRAFDGGERTYLRAGLVKEMSLE